MGFKSRGFSLIELMVGVMIVGILAAVSLGSLSAIQKSNDNAKRQADLRIIQGALQQFYADQHRYPLSLGSSLTNCSGATGCSITKNYLSSIPTDPIPGTSTPYCYAALTAVGGTACTDSNCHYYELGAKLDNPANPVASSCNGNTNYNYKVTPL